MSTDRNDTPAQPTAAPTDRRNVLQNALAAIERLQARLDASERARHEPIAIVGMACRLPGGVSDPDAYWELLTQGRDVVGEVPPDRWNVDDYYDPDPGKLGKARTKAGAFVDGIDQFEPGFFGMSPREAAGVDPQQRLLLEVTWEALENAGVPVDQLDGSLTGVFVGITSMDYAQRIDVNDPARSDIYLATGTALNAAAGRVSFTFGFRGPCMAIDTACSSSMVAIHTACQSLRDGESNLVVAGGVNAILSPDPFVLISKWGMLSPDGRCKTFDASANGFVRGEGCGLIVLERLSDALANGRRVLGVIRGSAINQDGKSSGLTVPNGLAQQEVVAQALAAARLKPADVSYVEAHGTGTSLGDPIEVEALATAYGEGRRADEPLQLGSVKSNIGHLEAASGVASVMKLALALRHHQLPASLHVRQLTPAIAWDSLPVRVSTALHEWTLPASGRRIAGASAFGFSGMNAHVLIEEAPEPTPPQSAPQRPLYLLPLSARNDAALVALAARYADHLERHPGDALADVCATAAIGRSHLSLRHALVAPDRGAMVAQLRALAAGEQALSPASAGGRQRVAFLFTGQGSQYVGMGRELYDSEPVFKATIDQCAAVLDPLLGRPLQSLLFADSGGLLDQTGNTQPAIFAIEVALAATWRAWGIEPAVVIGHSVGEYAAAVVAGVFSLEDGARLIAARGRLMQALPAGGAMVSVQGDVERIHAAIAPHASQVSIAAFNAPGNTVIAGAGAEVKAIAAQLESQGMRTQALVVSHAFHSPLMEPMLDEFRAIAAGVVHAPPAITWISNLDGAPLDWAAWGPRMADYWTRHVREPVAFEAGMRALAATQCDVHIEVGPHPTLIGLGTQCVSAERPIDWLPSLKRGKPAWDTLYDSAARLYVRGARLNWAAVQGPGVCHSLALPTYPFQRQRFSIPFKSASRRSSGPAVHELLGARASMAGVVAVFERSVDSQNPSWLCDHRIASEVVMPLAAYLEATLAALRQVDSAITVLDAVEVGEPMPLPEGQPRLMQVLVDRSGVGAPLRARVFSRDGAREDAEWTLHASAQASTAPASAPGEPLAAVARMLTREVDVAPFYEKMRQLGADFGAGFRGMRRVWCGSAESIGEVELSPEGAEAQFMHPALMDACFHIAAVALDTLPGADDGRMYLPIGVERYHWYAAPKGRLRSHARVRPPAVRADMLLIDIHVETLAGEPVAYLEGMHCRRASRDMFRQRVEAQVAGWLYELSWESAPLTPVTDLTAAAAGRWLVFDDGEGRGERLAAVLAAQGAQVQRVLPRGAAGMAAPDRVEIDPSDAQAFVNLVAGDAEAAPLRGVVSLWPLRVPALGEDDLPSAGQALGTEAALHTLQALGTLEPGEGVPPPRLWFVTRGSQTVDGTETLRIEQAPVAGLVRVAATEHPEWRVSLLDLDPQASPADARQLADELLADSTEQQVALRKGARYAARLARRPRNSGAPHVDDAPQRLHIAERGTLENLHIGSTDRRPPGPGQVEIRVRASGLNFRDVLSALGMYPGEIKHLGSDCAGEVVALGEGVTQFAIGDRVVAMADGSFASHATTRWEFVAPLPAGVSFEQGAAVPTAYLTADVTLNLIAGMRAGQRVLIHSGAGGVGMAAIALARRAGAEIFATAGSPDKRDVLRRLGVHHVLDSRSTSFADEIARITGGQGVDIVLNSLAGELMDRSFDSLADGGVFLEIGKRGLWTHERVAALGRGIRYHIVDCNDNARDTPQIVGEIFTRVLKEIESGVLPWLPCTTFPFEQAPDAFRYMAQARHIGRVVFRHTVVPGKLEQAVDPHKSYLVTGGLKGLGLVAARWLADEGARQMVLAARSEPDADARAAIAAMTAQGVSVRTVAADVASADGVQAMMGALQGLAPLGGVLHCAGVLDDGVLLKQTPQRFAQVMGPKADGAWRLHLALRRGGHRPGFFVLYSSLSAVFGSAGQGNYVAANAFLDALAVHRQDADLPALSVNWGAWSEVGMAVRGDTAARAGAQGLLSLSPREGMQALDLLVREGATRAAVAPIDWALLGRQLAGASTPPLLSRLLAAASTQGQARGAIGPASLDYGSLAPAERRQQLLSLVRRELATVLGLAGAAQSIPLDQPFPGLGLDSLTSVELRNRLQQALGRPIAATAAFDWPTVQAMAEHLDSLYGAAETPQKLGQAPDREEMTL